ncbi:MAG: hypothetical protein ACTSXW_02710 [Candidatus Baldrarchaeia archaeon]
MFKVEIIGRILNFKQETIVAILHCKNNDYLKLIYKIVLEALKINSSVLILDCSYSFREEILRNLCKEHKIHLDFLESRLKKIIVRKETQFLSILRQIYHGELMQNFKILISLHISLLLEKSYKKLKEREQAIKDVYSVIPLLKSPDRIIFVVEKMLEGFYPTECIVREEIKQIANQKIYFLPYKTININGTKITYQHI